VIFIGVGSWNGLPAYGLTVPDLPSYTNTSFRDLGIAIAVGLVSALLLSSIREGGHLVLGLRTRGIGMLPLLVSGGAAVGVLAMVARELGANSQDVLFSGQTSVGVVVAENSTKLVLVLVVCKGIAYAISLGCGFRGGPIFPAIFLGVGIASLPVVWFNMSPTVAIAMGAAAGMASQTRLLFAPVLFAELLVGRGGGDATPAAVLATAAAWIVTKALDKRAAAPEASAAPAPAPAPDAA
jgi:H+/Cl- antiporter ClcA